MTFQVHGANFASEEFKTIKNAIFVLCTIQNLHVSLVLRFSNFAHDDWPGIFESCES
jgi:hypothetical protein